MDHFISFALWMDATRTIYENQIISTIVHTFALVLVPSSFQQILLAKAGPRRCKQLKETKDEPLVSNQYTIWFFTLV